MYVCKIIADEATNIGEREEEGIIKKEQKIVRQHVKSYKESHVNSHAHTRNRISIIFFCILQRNCRQVC